MERHASGQNLIFLRRKLLPVINESYREHEKCVEEVFTPKLTATSRAKGGSYRRRKRNMQRRPSYPKATGSQDPEQWRL